MEDDKQPKDRLFKNRYDNNLEFRARHLAYVSQKLECECGKTVMRSNMSVHRKSKVHESKIGLIKSEQKIKELTEYIHSNQQ
jgi:hypothetical protein